ncbi:hypothetical protein [Hydrogenophaga defluvii]|uniref:BIG2 domain-containing protein n=1 Tax=Hydrogenophaga defluvii TaxID=249410 RepID=A0ABW2S9N4_9BURK
MKPIRIVIGLLLAAFLGACGGGGGSPGGNPNQPDLVSTAGDEVTLLPGAANSYGVSGGIPPYRVANADPATAFGVINGKVLTVFGVRVGAATVGVIDYAGDAISIDVTVGSSMPLDTTAPATLDLGLGAASARQFGISGGVAPYTVSSSNSSVVSAVISGSTFTLTGLLPGTATVSVRDAANVVKSIEVTAAAAVPLYTTAADSITVVPVAVTVPPTTVGVRTFEIGGGVSPYRVSSSNSGVVDATVDGNTLTVTGRFTGTATLTVRDAVNETVEIEVTVAPQVELYTSAPAAVTVAVGATSTFNVAGGVAPYSAASSNQGVATATVTGTSLAIRGVANLGGGPPAVAGTATVLVSDAVGSQVTITVTVP